MQHLGELGVSVRRKYWRQGFGSALLNALIRWSPGAGVTKVALRVKDPCYDLLFMGLELQLDGMPFADQWRVCTCRMPVAAVLQTGLCEG